MTKHNSNRSGFTLIELLTVIAIMSILAAITAGGISRVRSSQQSRNTDLTITKLQGALDQQWKALSDKVNKDKADKKLPPVLLTFCGNDPDRAAALYLYALTRRDFPQTFEEATGAITIGTPPNAFVVSPRTTFSSTTAIGGFSGASDPVNEAAALLYLILSESSADGTKFNADDATTGSQDTITVRGKSCRVFKDAWGTPISFVRFAQSTELDSPPFVNASAAAGKRDPLDPLRKLADAWPTTVAGNQTIAAGAVGVASFDGRNKQPAVISAGPNKNWDGTYDMDNIVGYRLRRQGGRGD